MDRPQACDQIQEACKQIALQMMKIHPAIPALREEAVQAEILKAAHALTVQLEVVKKQVIRLRGRDGSREL